MTIKQLLSLSTDQLQEEYVLTLGGAVYYFSLAEWMAANCCEIMQNGYVRDVCTKSKKITAWNIAEKLVSLSGKLSKSDEQHCLVTAAAEFQILVSDARNPLLHAYPAAVDDIAVLHNPKDQQTFSLSALEDIATRSFNCENVLNHAYYNYLIPKFSNGG
ncbi:hypothetical protein [Granulosicoccus antarcticus]|uniref:Uncharacterized protein n=1 Tax=Granulosicoccus antarcticus IMCC3135 TaxID=1192854 RepID=A0A2Z2NZ81_9GAMM|nr:hypothetical protein [Granulosicoccus antarcticus]ASJ76756.1 hypothetical protein IMCC3135_33575 [Granulosicoccus antarcticus IMCC3135]